MHTQNAHHPPKISFPERQSKSVRQIVICFGRGEVRRPWCACGVLHNVATSARINDEYEPVLTNTLWLCIGGALYGKCMKIERKRGVPLGASATSTAVSV